MKPIKLNIRTKSENYPILIGSNLIQNLNKYLKENFINFNQCLIIIDKNVPNKMILKVIRSLKQKKLFKFLFNANEKNKNQKNVNQILEILLKGNV